MRITVCELPHQTDDLERSWTALCEHTIREQSELVLLPEFAFVELIWQAERFDLRTWADAEAACNKWLDRLNELNAMHIIGARPITANGQRYNEGFAWSSDRSLVPLRRKRYLPNEPGSWEARWVSPGDQEFSMFLAGNLSFGLNICTELWALETYAAYASLGIAAILSPRATAAATTNKWLSIGTVAAVRTGAFSLSSNRVHSDGSCGGVGWIISPDGELLAKTSNRSPFCTVDVNIDDALKARKTYPRYVFNAGV